MKISFVIPGVGGGGGRVIMEYAQGLLNRGHEVRLLYRRTRTDLRTKMRQLYLRARYGGRGKWQDSFSGQIVSFDVLTPELAGRSNALVAIGADCVLEISRLPAECGLKVNNCHGRELENMERMHQAWDVPMPRIVVSSHLVTEMRARNCTDEIVIVYNGVDRREYFPSVPAEERHGVGTVYHGAYTKNPELMLEVFRRLHRERPALPLFMFGSYPRPAGLPASTQYLRLPAIQAARDLYSRADVWFCGSRSEGFPGPVLEAMACGCAVVGTECGGTSDQIENGVNGFLVPNDDASALTKRVLQLVDSPEMRKQMAAASENKLRQFTWPNCLESLENALAGFVSRSRASERKQILSSVLARA